MAKRRVKKSRRKIRADIIRQEVDDYIEVTVPIPSFPVILGPKWQKRGTPFNLLMRTFCNEAWVEKKQGYRSDKLEANEGYFLRIGIIMETDVALLQKINEESKESSRILRETYNEVKKTADMLQPELSAMVERLRITRMTTTTELVKSLKVMHEVRDFFKHRDYKMEIGRLEKFCNLAERLNVLMKDGTLDVLVEIVLKLGEGEKYVRKREQSTKESGTD